MKLVKLVLGRCYHHSQNLVYARIQRLLESRKYQTWYSYHSTYNRVILILVQTQFVRLAQWHRFQADEQILSQEYPNDFLQIYLE